MQNITKESLLVSIQENEIGLTATQPKLCLPIINRIFKKMAAGVKFPGIKVENNLICDGHHRYIASILANFQLEKNPGSVTLSTRVIKWEAVVFEEEDWDTAAKIQMLNEQDAAFNNIPIEQIIELLK